MSIVDEVKNKTKQLVLLKNEYNSMVSAVDEEFSSKKALINEMTIHFPLSLARNCLDMLQKSPNNAKRVAELLKQLRDEENDYDFYEEEEEFSELQNLVTNSKLNDDSSYDSLDEGSFHLDDEKFFGQFNQNSDPLE